MRFPKHSQEPRFCLLSWSKPRGGRYSQEPTFLAFSQTFKSLLLPLKLFKAKRRTLQTRVVFLGAKIATPNLWLFFAYF